MDDFEYLRVIGKGSYGEVWLAKHKKDKKQYVLKRMNLQRASKRERTSAEQEAKLLSKLKHPNIVSYKDSFETRDGKLHIAMQYCEGGDLYTRLKEQKGIPLEERQVVEWFVQIAMALQYMHERNILHRDLKTQNIFLTKSKIIKVGDLGIARVLESASDMATTLIGTPYYMSPELFSNKPYNHKSDVWALGCCVYEMTTLKHAFNAKDMNSLVYKILKGKTPPMPRQYGTDLQDLMRQMLDQNPDRRPSVNRILRNPFIKRNIAIFLEDTKRGCRRPGSAAKRPGSASSNQSSPASTGASIPSSAAGNRSAASESGSGGFPPRPSQQRQQLEPTRDEPDSTPELKNQKPDGTGDAPSFKLGHARKPSDAAPKELEPIQEDSVQKTSKDSLSSKEDTIVPSPVKEAKEVQEEAKPEEGKRKKKKKLVPSRPVSNSHDKHVKNADTDALSARSDVSTASKSEESRSGRPLPVPKVEKSEGLPQKREALVQQEKKVQREEKGTTDSTSSKSSSLSDGLAEDTPRSLPNLSARERRREKHTASSSMEHPNSARVQLRRVPERAGSEKVTRKEKSSALKTPQRQRQPSLQDSSSSSDESQPLQGENTREREKRRENKEMSNFISILDSTLKMNCDIDKSDEELKEVPVNSLPRLNGRRQEHTRSLRVEEEKKPVEPQKPVEEPPPVHKSASMPSVETLTSTSRLMNRIRLLRKDCFDALGYEIVKKAYDILERIEEDAVEPQLMELLGKERFDEYAGKIWQLKFCEESYFMS